MWDDAYVHLQDAFDQANAVLSAEIRSAKGMDSPDNDADEDHSTCRPDASSTRYTKPGARIAAGRPPPRLRS